MKKGGFSVPESAEHFIGINPISPSLRTMYVFCKYHPYRKTTYFLKTKAFFTIIEINRPLFAKNPTINKFNPLPFVCELFTLYLYI